MNLTSEYVASDFCFRSNKLFFLLLFFRHFWVIFRVLSSLHPFSHNHQIFLLKTITLFLLNAYQTSYVEHKKYIIHTNIFLMEYLSNCESFFSIDLILKVFLFLFLQKLGRYT